MKQLIVFILLMIWFGLHVKAQTVTMLSADTVMNKPMQEHSVKKATLLSTAFPGLGQIYNRKIWKAPIVYAGIGTCIYFIHDNNRNYKYYRDALIAETDGNPATVNPTGATAAQIRPVMEQYRQWLDLSVVALAVVYALNIVDAHVDAHLFMFDVSEDISASLRPTAITTTRINPGFSLTINF